MITKKRARQQQEDFERHTPIASMGTINHIIDTLSSLGNPAVSLYIPKNKLESYKNSLRKRGFSVQYVVFESLPNEAYITIVWDIADFNATESGKKIRE